MKRLICDIKRILSGREGESLMESIISLLILTMLLVTVTLMINTSLGMTGYSTARASKMREDANTVIKEAGGGVDRLSLSGDDINVEIAVGVAEEGGYTAFAP